MYQIGYRKFFQTLKILSGSEGPELNPGKMHVLYFTSLSEQVEIQKY